MKKIGTISIIIACCTAVIALGLLAYIGYYNRYWGDDWCYNRDFKTIGVLGSLNGYLYTGENALRGYATNRYSLTLLSGLLYIPGIAGVQITPILIVALWIGALLWILFKLSKIYRPLPKIFIIAGALFLLSFTLYFSPQRFQVLYWRSGVHYSFTIILGLYIAAFILSQMTNDRASPILNYMIAPLAFIAGGLSETSFAYLFSAIVLLFLIAWIGKQKKLEWAEKSFFTIGITLIALLASMVALIVSPSNDRYQTMSVKSANPLIVPVHSLRFALDFMIDSLKSMPVPHLVFLTFFISLAILSELSSSKAKSLSLKTAAITIIATSVITFLLIAAVQAPTVYFYNSIAEPRTQSLSRFTMLSGLSIIAWVIGQLIVSRQRGNWLFAIAILCMVLTAIYTSRIIFTNFSDVHLFETRARLWDQRDAILRSDQVKGIKKANAIAIDTKGWEVEDMMKSKLMNGQWVNTCASQYYGFDAIRAVAP